MSWRRSGYAGLLAAVFSTGLLAGYLIKTASSGRMLSRHFPRAADTVDEKRVLAELHRKFQLYHDRSSALSLSRGMVVIKDIDGRLIHSCDSLLFSALRYVSLLKAGEHAGAVTAWNAINGSFIGGNWRRHPACRDKATSRDMILGLLIALSANPGQGKNILEGLVARIRDGGGYFDDGPFYVSYMTPQIADLIRLLWESFSLPVESLPPLIRYSFSTLDINSMELRRGYQSHLLALGLWLEMELLQASIRPESGMPPAPPRSAFSLIRATVPGVNVGSLYLWHWDFVAEKLAALDPDNMFYRYLFLKANDLLDRRVLLELAQEMIEMPQFPHGFLPMDCDRKADYLWQRDSREMEMRKPECGLVYPGVDYMWMAANIMSDLERYTPKPMQRD